MLSIHIKHLLDTNSRVIIPDLGAFILKGDSSTIYFNEFLRFNDGVLVDYLVQADQIDNAQANKQVKDFVEMVNQKLSSDKQVNIEGIGLLYYDANEKIQLNSEGTTTATPAASQQPAPPKVVPEPEVKKPEPVTEPVAVAKTEPAPVKPEPIAPPAKTETPATPAPPKKEAPVAAKAPEPEAKIVAKPAEKPVPPQKAKPSVTAAPKAKSTSNKKLYAILAGSAVIVVILIYLFPIRPGKHVKDNKEFTYEESQKADSIAKDTVKSVKTNAPSHKAATKASAKTSSPQKPAVAATKASTKEVKARPAPIAPSSGGKKYYLVAGCFSVETNADKFVSKLKTEGFDAEKFASIKNMYHVSYASFPDKSEAAREMTKLRESGHEQVWILGY